MYSGKGCQIAATICFVSSDMLVLGTRNKAAEGRPKPMSMVGRSACARADALVGRVGGTRGMEWVWAMKYSGRVGPAAMSCARTPKNVGLPGPEREHAFLSTTYAYTTT